MTNTLTHVFTVPEMSCQHCVNAIKQEVGALEGVQGVEVVLDTYTVTVAHEPQVSSAAIVAAINEAGYDDVTQVS
jgi:copper ion binding protein